MEDRLYKFGDTQKTREDRKFGSRLKRIYYRHPWVCRIVYNYLPSHCQQVIDFLLSYVVDRYNLDAEPVAERPKIYPSRLSPQEIRFYINSYLTIYGDKNGSNREQKCKLTDSDGNPTMQTYKSFTESGFYHLLVLLGGETSLAEDDSFEGLFGPYRVDEDPYKAEYGRYDARELFPVPLDVFLDSDSLKKLNGLFTKPESFRNMVLDAYLGKYNIVTTEQSSDDYKIYLPFFVNLYAHLTGKSYTKYTTIFKEDLERFFVNSNDFDCSKLTNSALILKDKIARHKLYAIDFNGNKYSKSLQKMIKDESNYTGVIQDEYMLWNKLPSVILQINANKKSLASPKRNNTSYNEFEQPVSEQQEAIEEMQKRILINCGFMSSANDGLNGTSDGHIFLLEKENMQCRILVNSLVSLLDDANNKINRKPGVKLKAEEKRFLAESNITNALAMGFFESYININTLNSIDKITSSRYINVFALVLYLRIYCMSHKLSKEKSGSKSISLEKFILMMKRWREFPALQSVIKVTVEVRQDDSSICTEIEEQLKRYVRYIPYKADSISISEKERIDIDVLYPLETAREHYEFVIYTDDQIERKKPICDRAYCNLIMNGLSKSRFNNRGEDYYETSYPDFDSFVYAFNNFGIDELRSESVNVFGHYDESLSGVRQAYKNTLKSYNFISSVDAFSFIMRLSLLAPLTPLNMTKFIVDITNQNMLKNVFFAEILSIFLVLGLITIFIPTEPTLKNNPQEGNEIYFGVSDLLHSITYNNSVSKNFGMSFPFASKLHRASLLLKERPDLNGSGIALEDLVSKNEEFIIVESVDKIYAFIDNCDIETSVPHHILSMFTEHRYNLPNVQVYEITEKKFEAGIKKIENKDNKISAAIHIAKYLTERAHPAAKLRNPNLPVPSNIVNQFIMWENEHSCDQEIPAVKMPVQIARIIDISYEELDSEIQQELDRGNNIDPQEYYITIAEEFLNKSTDPTIYVFPYIAPYYIYNIASERNILLHCNYAFIEECREDFEFLIKSEYCKGTKQFSEYDINVKKGLLKAFRRIYEKCETQVKETDDKKETMFYLKDRDLEMFLRRLKDKFANKI